MIVFSGDTHCPIDVRKLNNHNVKSVCNGDYPSHVIVLGDFGLIWSLNPNNEEEAYWTKWFNDKPWITLAVLGNHENYERIYQLPLVDLYGGKAYKVSDKIYILQHGHVFAIEGKTFFNFGGAVSIDKARRQNRISWWEEENPTQSDFMRGNENLQKVGYAIDYVISHTCPQEAINTFQHTLPFGHLDPEEDRYYELKKNDPAVRFLSEYVKSGLKFRGWYCGHFHIDRSVLVEDRAYHVLYNNLHCLYT